MPVVLSVTSLILLTNNTNTRQSVAFVWFAFWWNRVFWKDCEQYMTHTDVHVVFSIWCSAERRPPSRQIQTLPVPLSLGGVQCLGVRAYRGQEAVPCRGTKRLYIKSADVVGYLLITYRLCCFRRHWLSTGGVWTETGQISTTRTMFTRI